MENTTGFCPRVIADLHKFNTVVVAGQAELSVGSCDMIKEMVGMTGVTFSARVSLIFRSQARLRRTGHGQNV